MGFTRPDPELFDAFARARLANRHMEDFLRVLETPLLDALRDAIGGDVTSASLEHGRGKRFSRHRGSNQIDIPFRIPADGPLRVRAGIIGWRPPAAFYVRPAPIQRWNRRRFTPEARRAVEILTAGHFEPEWMSAYLNLDADVVTSPRLEETVLRWAHERFTDIARSGLLDLPVTALGNASAPDASDGGDGAS